MIRARLYRCRLGSWQYVVTYRGVAYLTDNTGSMAALIDQCRLDVAVLRRWVSAGYELPKPLAYIPQPHKENRHA